MRQPADAPEDLLRPRLQTLDEVAAPAPVPRHRIESGTQHQVEQILTLVRALGAGAHCHEARLYRTGATGWGTVLHCDFDPDLPMREIHRRTERIEYALRQHFPDLEYALIQAEPAAMHRRPAGSDEAPHGNAV